MQRKSMQHLIGSGSKTQSLEPVHCLYGLANVIASYLIAALRMLAVSMLLDK